MKGNISRRSLLSLLAVVPLTSSRLIVPKTVSFSDMRWKLKSSSGPVGPGPNYFTEGNVFVDEQGRLHLRITRRDGHWTCAELIGTHSLGYGTYRFDVADTSSLDANAVLGLFTWDTAARQHHFREIDIEVSRWGVPENQNGQFVVQPYTRPLNIVRFEIPPGPTTHSIQWVPGHVFCRCTRENLMICEHEFGAGVPSAGRERPIINLWLFGGRPRNTTSDIHVIVERFSFIPSSSASNLPSGSRASSR
jgi:hypothetical protein